jgi:hypothetical protein
MKSGSTIHTRLSRFGVCLLALTLFGILLSGCGGSYRSTYSSGSIQDQQMRTLLKQSGYEGGGTVVEVSDPITGSLIGTSEDQRVRVLLKQAGYEGGGTVVHGA